MTQIIFPVVGAYLFYKLGTNLMQKAGITPDKNETKGENAQIKLNEEKLWSPEFYQTAAKKVAPKKITVHTYASDSALAEKIYYAKGYTYDTESQAVGAIRACKSKAHISRLSEVFFQKYELDLYGYLYSFLEPADWLQISGHVKNIPPYILAK